MMQQRNWWDEYEQVASSPAARPGIVGPPRRATPQTPGQEAYTDVQTRQGEAALQLTPLQQRHLELQNLTMEGELARGGMTADQAAEARQRRARLEAASAQFASVANQYRGGYQNSDAAGWLPDFLSPGNAGFNTAAGNLAEQSFGAFRIPGVGSQSDWEGRQFAENNRLSAQSFDTSNEARLDALQERLNANRGAAGLPPIDWRNLPQAQLTQDQPQEQADVTQRYAGTPSGEAQTQVDPTGSVARFENDPVLQGVSARLGRMVAEGAPDGEILRFLSDNRVNPGDTNIAATLRYRRTRDFQLWRQQNPGRPYPIDEGFYRREVPQTGTSQTMSQVAASPFGAYAAAAGNAVAGNRIPSIVGLTGGDENQARAGMEGLRQMNPMSSLAGDVSGQVMTYAGGNALANRLAPGLARFLPQGSAARGIAGDAAYGAYSGSGQNGLFDPSGIPLAMAANVGGGLAGRTVANAGGRALSGSRDVATRYLSDRGFPLTMGQISGQGGRIGQVVENLENTATSVPVIGPAINAQRAQGLQRFNTATMEDVVQPISGTQSGVTGELANEEALGQIQAAYRGATNGVTLPRDRPFTAELRHATLAARRGTIPADQRELLNTAIAQVDDLFENGQMSGQSLQGALQIVNDAKAALTGERLSRPALAALRQTERALMGLARRHNPEMVPALNRANAAYRRFSIARNASLRGINNAGGGGEFTPAQLGFDARQGTINYGGRNQAASTNRPFFELQRHGQQVLPNTYPDSGTAGRLLAPAVGLGMYAGGSGADALAGGLGGDTNGWGGTLGAGALATSLAYTNPGRAAIQAAMVRRPNWARRAGDYVPDSQFPRLMGLIGAPLTGYRYENR